MLFPTDYRPAFGDVEDICADMVQTELDRCTPGGFAGTRLPNDAEERIAAGEAVVRIHVMPGSVVDEVFRYTPVQFEVVCASRNDSRAVMQFLEDELIRKFGEGGIVARLDGSRESVRSFAVDETQQSLVFMNPDHRMVEATFRVATKKRTPR